MNIILMGLGLFALVALVIIWKQNKSLLVKKNLGRNIVIAFIFGIFLPGLVLDGVVSQVNQNMQKKEFCAQCHVMQPYVKGLQSEDEEVLSAVHVQNNFVDKDRACYVCHTSYSAFGGIKAKWNGLHHVWVNYFKEIPQKIKIYTPYANADCLRCHESSKRFLEQRYHKQQANFITKVKDGSLRCLKCHEVAHDNEVKNED